MFKKLLIKIFRLYDIENKTLEILYDELERLGFKDREKNELLISNIKLRIKEKLYKI